MFAVRGRRWRSLLRVCPGYVSFRPAADLYKPAGCSSHDWHSPNLDLPVASGSGNWSTTFRRCCGSCNLRLSNQLGIPERSDCLQSTILSWTTLIYSLDRDFRISRICRLDTTDKSPRYRLHALVDVRTHAGSCLFPKPFHSCMATEPPASVQALDMMAGAYGAHETSRTTGDEPDAG